MLYHILYTNPVDLILKYDECLIFSNEASLFIQGLTSLSTLYRERKPVHTVGQGSVLQNADQRQATTSVPT